MAITLDQIKNLRSRSGVGITDCKKALEESKGDEKKALEYLREKGVLKARKRADKLVSNGFIASYVHQGRIGVLVEVVCETDFVSSNVKFQEFAKELALHIAAENPLYVSKETIPDNVIAKEKELAYNKLEKEKKPKEVIEKIIEGQLEKFYEEVCLLSQNYVRDTTKTVENLLHEQIAAFGEKIEIRKFIRIVLGEE